MIGRGHASAIGYLSVLAFYTWINLAMLNLNSLNSKISGSHLSIPILPPNHNSNNGKNILVTLATQCENIIDNSYYKSQSGEDKMLLSWFSNLCGGTYLEMGALNGVKYSNSYVFHKALQWKGVLIELMSSNYQQLIKNRPDEIATIHAGVCSSPQQLHYHAGRDAAVGGIYEFASSSFREMYWRNISLDDERVLTMDCATLDNLLLKNAANATFFDFFSLDVEGAELSVLQSINFDRVGFGVVFAESDEHNQRKNLALKVFMDSKGYMFVQEWNRSYWFVNRQFHEIYKDLVY